jgi:hypothetical protein
MNLTRRTLLAPALVCLTLNALPLTKDECAKRITSLHTRIWGVDNLLLKPITKADESDWRELMNQVRTYVVQNGPSDADGWMKKLDGASTQAITVRKVSYNFSIKKALETADQVAGLDRLDPRKIKFNQFDAQKLAADNARTLQSNLDDIQTVKNDVDIQFKLIQSKTNVQKQKDALDIMKRISLTLELTLQKLIKDGQDLSKASPAG